MPRKAIGDRPLKPAEKQARLRQKRKSYLASLERAVCAADDGEPIPVWRDVFAETIASARASLEKRND